MSAKPLNKIAGILTHDRFNLALIALGVGLRLRHFLENRSLWLDEAYVATRIIGRSYMDILQDIPMFPYQPKEPLVFSLIEKFFTHVFGNTEFALRLLPFVASVLSLILFYRFMKHYVDARAVPIALGLFALCDPVVYYAAEVKPYSSDVLVALVLLGLYKFIIQREYSYGRYLLFGLAGSACFWLSFPALFVVAGLGTSLLLFNMKKMDRDLAKALLTIGLFWLISFGAVYVRYFAVMTNSGYILGTWQDAFLPLSGTVWDQMLWVKKAWFGVFQSPLGLSSGLLGFLFFACGCLAVFQKDRGTGWILLLPVLFAFVAALFQKYPFKGRVLFFAIPALLIFLSEGVVLCVSKLKRYRLLVGMIIVAVLFFQPLKVSALNLINKREREENRAVMTYFSQHYRHGDMVYMNISAQFPFWYYSGQLGIINRFPLKDMGLWKGGPARSPEVGKIHDKLGSEEGRTYFVVDYVSDLYDTKGIFKGFRPQDSDQTYYIFNNTEHRFTGPKRVWLILAHIDEAVQKHVLQYFDRRGTRIQFFQRKGAGVYLYELEGDANRG